MQAFISGFCSSGYDFAIASSRPHLAMRTLQVAMGFVDSYAPDGLSPQTDGMPVIHMKIVDAGGLDNFTFINYDVDPIAAGNGIFHINIK